MNTTLMNFRVPNQIKNDFNKVCKSRCSNMTAETVRFMMEFISKNDSNGKDKTIQKQFNGTVIEQHGNLVKDPITQTWVNKSDWENCYEQ